jgi:glycosyltransferase involved in cell wall biosynthesis
MRISILIDSLNNGGAEKFAVELCNSLSLENSVSLIVKKRVNRENVPFQILNDRVKLIELANERKWSFAFVFELYRLLKSQNPDVIHVHSSILVIHIFFLPIFFPKTNFIQTIHSQLTNAYKKNVRWLNRWRWIGIQWKNVVISKSILAEFQNFFPFEKFFLIENGVTAPNFPIDLKVHAREKKKLVAVGNFSSIKRFDALADVMMMPEIRAKFDLDIVGEERTANKPVTNYITNLNAQHIRLLGSRSDVQRILYESDALVIWSSFEGMPLVVLEALSVGCPVIGSPVGGIPDILVNGKVGWLATSTDNIALRDALLEFNYLNGENLMTMKERCLESYHTRFSMNRCSASYCKLYSSSR